jgi:hypothetical protein
MERYKPATHLSCRFSLRRRMKWPIPHSNARGLKWSLKSEEDMKIKNLWGGLLFMTAALILFGTFGCKKSPEEMAKACEERMVTVLNPALSSPLVERVPLAPRTGGSLDGKTIYLVDMQWGGPQAGYSVFEEMQKWFSKNMPSVKTVLRRTKNGWMGIDSELQKEIAEKKPAGVVIGIGG